MNEFTEQANQMAQTEANEQAAQEQRELNEESHIARNVEVTIDDREDAVALDVDTAKRVLVAAGIPVVGLPKLTSFDGTYHVDLPAAFWAEVEESGFYGESAYYTVRIETF